jgi:hypothetical protein
VELMVRCMPLCRFSELYGWIEGAGITAWWETLRSVRPNFRSSAQCQLYTSPHTLSITEPIVQQLVLYISVQCANMCQTGRADVVFFQVQHKWNRTSWPGPAEHFVLSTVGIWSHFHRFPAHVL